MDDSVLLFSRPDGIGYYPGMNDIVPLVISFNTGLPYAADLIFSAVATLPESA